MSEVGNQLQDPIGPHGDFRVHSRPIGPERTYRVPNRKTEKTFRNTEVYSISIVFEKVIIYLNIMNLRNNCLRTGAYILIDSLVQNGVEHIFGYPGGAILPIYDELYFWEKSNLLKHILVRHEQGAIHAAQG